MKLRNILITALLVGSAFSAGCGNAEQKNGYIQISQQEAKRIIDAEDKYIIIDVREQSEYDSGHIPGAILLPLGTVEDQAETVLKDKKQKILVYCRSGNRSKQAAQILADLGYTNVYEFGGITTWPYEIEV